MRSRAATKPEGKALQQIIRASKARTSFAVESDIRALAGFHDFRHRKTAAITISRADMDLLKDARSVIALTGMYGGHRVVVNGETV